LFNNYSIEGLVDILESSFCKVSYILGTRATCSVLGINRYCDKFVKASMNQYRIMNKNKSFKFHTNTLHQLMVSGKTVIDDYQVLISKLAEKYEKYHNTELYCTVDEDIIKLNALKEDIYYTSDLKAINIGFIKRGLLLLPYVEDVLVSLKIKDDKLMFIPFVSLNKEMLKRAFEYPDFFTIEKHLESELLNFKEFLPRNTILNSVVILDSKFFKGVDRHYEDRYYFIRSISNPTAD